MADNTGETEPQTRLVTGASMTAPAALTTITVQNHDDKVVVYATAHRDATDGTACWVVALTAPHPEDLLDLLRPVVKELEGLANG